MLPYRKKLIEVALPLKAINEASAREKSIRHGHPSTLHLWWARRPLAACRAVLFASLVDDPDSDPAYRKPNGKVDEDRAGFKRTDLFNLIEELVQWENSNNPAVINSARAEIARCVASRLIETGKLKAETKVVGAVSAGDLVSKGHCRPHAAAAGKEEKRQRWLFDVKELPPAEAVNAFLAEHAPPVLDPFCGGGSIPLEAQRLGLRAYASDLNPVPVLITKALIEIPPKFAGRPPVNPEAKKEKLKSWTGAQGLADDVRYYGQWLRDEAQKRIGHLYPKVKITKAMAKDRPYLEDYVGRELTIIAWLWARTVASPNPAYQDIHVPLVRGFWLNKKAGKAVWIEPVVDRKRKSYCFEVRVGSPTSDQKKSNDAGTKLGRGCKFRCLLSDEPIPEEHIKQAGMRGELGSSLMTVVAEGDRCRIYLPPEAVPAVTVEEPKDLRGIDAPLANDPRNLWCLGYGLDRFDKLFTTRQLVALTTFSDLVQEARERVLADAKKANLPNDGRPLADGGTGSVAYADAVATYLAFNVSKMTDLHNTCCTWKLDRGCPVHLFARQAIPMVWDFPEANPFSDSSGSWDSVFWHLLSSMSDACLPALGTGHMVRQLDATASLGETVGALVSTDPPYYDNIGYADLSDFFYVWLRRALGPVYPSLFATLLTPKKQELIASPYRHEGGKDQAHAFFEGGFGRAFSLLHKSMYRDAPLTVFYAFKQAEGDDGEPEESSAQGAVSTGWETMLEGVIRAGFLINGTWPIRTEMGARMIGMGTNALASSIVLVCRPRPADASLATRKEFITALRKELPEALKDLQQSNIAPVDLAQAAIGPGMAVFTRYAKVIEADGSPMSVRIALGLVNQALDETLAEQEGDFDSDTRWALAWFEQYGASEGPFGVAETLSKAKNTAVGGLVEAGVVKSSRGKVQLLSRKELPTDWDPATDRRLTVWEIAQHLIRVLETEGEAGAAALLNKLGGLAETARELAYRLYSLCERKKWADEALAYNGLVIAWPELTKLAQAAKGKDAGKMQSEMFK